MNILSLGLKPLYERNIAYYKIIKEFRHKLPRHQNQATQLSVEEVDKNLLLPKSAKYVTVLNTSTHKPNLSELEIDLFYNKINDFNFSFVFFKSHYKEYTNNINRLRPTGSRGDLDLIVLQRILQDDPLHPLRPFDILIYHLKWKYRLTSSIYTRWIQAKRHNH